MSGLNNLTLISTKVLFMILKSVSHGVYLTPTSEIVIVIRLGSLKCMSTISDAITKIKLIFVKTNA